MHFTRLSVTVKKHKKKKVEYKISRKFFFFFIQFNIAVKRYYLAIFNMQLKVHKCIQSNNYCIFSPVFSLLSYFHLFGFQNNCFSTFNFNFSFFFFFLLLYFVVDLFTLKMSTPLLPYDFATDLSASSI